MNTAVASLAEIAAARDTDPRDIIEDILGRIDSADERTKFLQGLMDRLLAAETDALNGVFEVRRWIGSWSLSLDLAADATFLAADDEANKLIAAGKLGDGIDGAELRRRYGR